MASSKDYLQFILEQLSELEEITYRAMMGEYILYYRGKIVGGIYDDRLLVKRVCEQKSVNVIFYDNDWAEGSQMSIQPLLYI